MEEEKHMKNGRRVQKGRKGWKIQRIRVSVCGRSMVQWMAGCRWERRMAGLREGNAVQVQRHDIR